MANIKRLPIASLVRDGEGKSKQQARDTEEKPHSSQFCLFLVLARDTIAFKLQITETAGKVQVRKWAYLSD